jgi:hypothetical protein
LEKKPISKKNHPKWSLGSEVINILKSANFQGFSANDHMILLISVEIGVEFAQKIAYMSSSCKIDPFKKKSSESKLQK